MVVPLTVTFDPLAWVITAYRAVVRRLEVGPGDSLLVMGGGKGTSFAGAQLGKALGARVILVGSNPALGGSLDRVEVSDGIVKINDAVLDEPYINAPPTYSVDTVVPEGSLPSLVRALAENPEAWAATPRICYAGSIGPWT